MSPSLCPAGHTSTSTDYCDTCGAVIAPAAPAPTSPVATVPASPDPAVAQTCPDCGTPAAPGALFCEGCGHDFTTGSSAVSSTTPGAPAPAPLAPPVPAPDPRTDEFVSAMSNRVSGRISTPTHAPESTSPTAPSPPASEPWVVEVWTDPEWYEAQQANEALPSSAPPGLVVIRERSVLVGRTSPSRNIHPQVDCGTDTGVSRRHCQLNTDGRRWWVEDLQSSNGTYVGSAGAPLPTDPLVAGQRREVMEGDRVYVGAWTRLVIRRALPGEI